MAGRSVMDGLRSLRRRLGARSIAASPQHALAHQSESRFARLEHLLIRVQRDVEQIKLHTGIVLGDDRAVALLATGDRIYVDPRDGGCGINLLTEGKYEEDEIRLFRRFLKPGMTILDIGANYGYYSIIAAPYIRPGGKVHAFEPNPHIHDLFSSSLYMNGLFHDVEPHRLGAYDSNGTLQFTINESSPGGAHIMRPTSRARPENLVITVPTARLDDELPSDLLVDLVKIDVEGHEEHALRGMSDIIGRSPNIVLFMELFPPLLDGDDDYDRLMRLITHDLGLGINRVLSGGRTIEADPESLRGEICTLILSKAPLHPAPDLTLYPPQLNRGADTQLDGGTIRWRQDVDTGASGRMIAHGPYVFLPKGDYRLVIDADVHGDILCRLLENFGDILWEGRIAAGERYEAEIHIVLDAPRLEIAFWSATDGDASFCFRKAEFWPLS